MISQGFLGNLGWISCTPPSYVRAYFPPLGRAHLVPVEGGGVDEARVRREGEHLEKHGERASVTRTP